MNSPAPVHEGFSLRAKLALSYLGVALGAIILIVIAITFVVQKYFYQSQIDLLRGQADYMASNLATAYQENRNSWDGMQTELKIPSYFSYFIITDAQGNLLTNPLPGQFRSYETALEQAVNQALHGPGTDGTLEGSTDDTDTFYVSVPIEVNHSVVGTVLMIQYNHYRPGLGPQDILRSINQALLVTGLCVSLLVIIFSLFMARRLTRPLLALTSAAEEMKAGNYTRRVEQPQNLDEIGYLAATFNAMADKIETDVNTLRAQEQLRRDLIANIAHDLVTPLTAIQGYSEAIADDVIVKPDERHETAQLIGREVQRLRRLVSDMQHMTSLEAGRLHLELAPLNLHDLVSETLAVIGSECEQGQIELHNAILPATPLALADSDRITQVLLNLLDNARRHTPPGGRITIGARPEGNVLITWVNDTGTGIHPQDLPYIFERFYRVDRSRSAANGGGSGLGLAIIKAIITAHGGSTWAQSAFGQGTTIFFTLPLAPAATRPESPKVVSPAAPGLPILPPTKS